MTDKITTYRESSAALEGQIRTLQIENARLKTECSSLKSRPCWHAKLLKLAVSDAVPAAVVVAVLLIPLAIAIASFVIAAAVK